MTGLSWKPCMLSEHSWLACSHFLHAMILDRATSSACNGHQQVKEQPHASLEHCKQQTGLALTPPHLQSA